MECVLVSICARNDAELGGESKRRPEDITTGPLRVVCNALKSDLAAMSPKLKLNNAPGKHDRRMRSL
jgi:hypothetical protein